MLILPSQGRFQPETGLANATLWHGAVAKLQHLKKIVAYLHEIALRPGLKTGLLSMFTGNGDESIAGFSGFRGVC